MSASLFSIVHASLPAQGETANGDAIVVRRFESGALIGVIDGLGHGPKAAEAAGRAVRELQELPLEAAARGVLGIVDALHDALRGSRGAAAMICRIDGDQIEGCGVGNVELRCTGTRIPVVLSPGILGVGRVRLRTFSGRLSRGCRLFLFSDGISRRAPFLELANVPADQACRQLIERYRRGYDDASVLVVSA